MRSSGSEAFWRLVFILILSLVPGIVLGEIAWVLCAVLIIYVLRHLYHLQRFNQWLSHPHGTEVPVYFGLWGDIYAQIGRMQRKHTQQKKQLAERLHQFEVSAAALPDAVIALGPQGEIRWFNQAARDLFTLRKTQDIGQPLVNLFRHPSLVRFIESRNVKKTLETFAPGNYECKLAIRITPYGDGLMLLLAQDITEHYRTEQVRKDFVANVSHELRTPLTVVSGFVENMLIQKDAPPNMEKWRKPLQLMDQQTTRMQSIVEDLLLLARLESTDDEAAYNAVNVHDLCQHLLTEGETLAKGKLTLELSLDSERGLLGDATQLRSAFSNLLFNALHYTPAGGQIKMIWQDWGDGAVFIVEDNGEGIAPQHIRRLTERFYRVDAGRSREHGGTGLGLAIVKHILQAHWANLDIESMVGKGSRFICRFPANRVTQTNDLSQ